MTRIQKCPPLIYVLNQTNPFLTIVSSLPKTHFNITPHFTHTCPKPGLTFWFTYWYALHFSYICHACYISDHFSVPPWAINVIQFNEQTLWIPLILMIGIYETMKCTARPTRSAFFYLCLFRNLHSTCFERLYRSSSGVYAVYAAACTYHANSDWLLDISSWNCKTSNMKQRFLNKNRKGNDYARIWQHLLDD